MRPVESCPVKTICRAPLGAAPLILNLKLALLPVLSTASGDTFILPVPGSGAGILTLPLKPPERLMFTVIVALPGSEVTVDGSKESEKSGVGGASLGGVTAITKASVFAGESSVQLKKSLPSLSAAPKALAEIPKLAETFTGPVK